MFVDVADLFDLLHEIESVSCFLLLEAMSKRNYVADSSSGSRVSSHGGDHEFTVQAWASAESLRHYAR